MEKWKTKIIHLIHFSLILSLIVFMSIGCGGGGSSGGGGGGGGGTAAIYPRFAYVASQIDDSVSTYAVEDDTGRLRYQGRVDAGNSPRSVTVDPSDSYAYVANYESDNVSQYTIGVDGRLTPMTHAFVDAGDGPRSVTVDPSGSYAYVANRFDDNVSQYAIGTNGTLTLLANPTVGAGGYPYSIVTTGRFQ